MPYSRVEEYLREMGFLIKTITNGIGTLVKNMFQRLQSHTLSIIKNLCTVTSK